MKGTDQRKSKRFELRLPLELIREGSRARQDEGETMNMSSAGVLFISSVELEIGSPIEYFITLQQGNNGTDGVRLRCMGKVVRRHSESMIAEGDDTIAMAATLERYVFVRAARN